MLPATPCRVAQLVIQPLGTTRFAADAMSQTPTAREQATGRRVCETVKLVPMLLQDQRFFQQHCTVPSQSSNSSWNVPNVAQHLCVLHAPAFKFERGT